ncbi:hypothetical protein ACFQU2_18685 [Siccirubricoccus deserti]
MQSNVRAAELAVAADDVPEALHAFDYMVYAYLQMAQDEAAQRAIDAAANVPLRTHVAPQIAFALAAMRARYVLERGAWAEAASLRPVETPFAFADALTYFARAIGLSRAGHPNEAAADIEALRRLHERLRGRDAYWAEQVDIQRQAAEGVVAFAAGRRGEGLEILRAAAEREARTEKHVVTPGPLAPARELYAEALLEEGQAAAALTEFAAVQQTEPRRFRAIAGAARAAEAAGNREEATRHYASLLEVAGSGGPTRAELAAARAYLARN